MSAADSLVMGAMKNLPAELGPMFLREVGHFTDALRANPERTNTFGVLGEFEMETAVRVEAGSPTAPLWQAFTESVRLTGAVIEMEANT